jgi:hypothetical protein
MNRWRILLWQEEEDTHTPWWWCWWWRYERKKETFNQATFTAIVVSLKKKDVRSGSLAHKVIGFLRKIASFATFGESWGVFRRTVGQALLLPHNFRRGVLARRTSILHYPFPHVSYVTKPASFTMVLQLPVLYVATTHHSAYAIFIPCCTTRLFGRTTAIFCGIKWLTLSQQPIGQWFFGGREREREREGGGKPKIAPVLFFFELLFS